MTRNHDDTPPEPPEEEIMRVCAATGLRPAELARLTWPDFQWGDADAA